MRAGALVGNGRWKSVAVVVGDVVARHVERLFWPLVILPRLALGGVGVFLADAKLAMTEILAGRTAPVTAVAWSPSEQSIAMATWNGDGPNTRPLPVDWSRVNAASQSLKFNDEPVPARPRRS